MVKKYLKEPPYPLKPNKWASKQTYIALGFFYYLCCHDGYKYFTYGRFYACQI